MDKRTASYVQTRFGDYYRRADVPEPPAVKNREFAVIPWTIEDDAPMYRHKSILDYDGVQGFLATEKPRHAYFSAALYTAPSEANMTEKNWLGADLVFDLDADHLPSVEGGDTYAERLEKCKEELYDLLSILDSDFTFEDLSVVFSGGRGYHVHVRDEGMKQLDATARREIVDHVRGEGIDFRDVVMENPIGDHGHGTTPLVLKHEGGWGSRVHHRLLELHEQLQTDEDEAIAHLQEFENIGEQKARKIISVLDEDSELVERGTVEISHDLKELTRQLTEETLERWSAEIDEPVTTDTHRLIRIPGSLHGSTSLQVTPLTREELETFNPLLDAVPDFFRGSEIDIEPTESIDIRFDGKHFEFEAGTVQRVPEHVGIFLMSRGSARKP